MCSTVGKPSVGRAGDALGRRIGGDEIRVLGLEALELVQQPVECLVGDLRRVVNVVALLVVADLLAELVDALEGHGALLNGCELPRAHGHGSGLTLIVP